MSYQTLFQDFMGLNNHFHDFTSYLVTFVHIQVNVYIVIDMHWCLYLKSDLVWNELMLANY